MPNNTMTHEAIRAALRAIAADVNEALAATASGDYATAAEQVAFVSAACLADIHASLLELAAVPVCCDDVCGSCVALDAAEWS